MKKLITIVSVSMCFDIDGFADLHVSESGLTWCNLRKIIIIIITKFI